MQEAPAWLKSEFVSRHLKSVDGRAADYFAISAAAAAPARRPIVE